MFSSMFAVCLLVKDFNRSVDFYTKVLRLKLREQNGKFADFELRGTSLAVFETSEATAMISNKYMNTGGASVLAFEVWDVAHTCKKLKKQGVEIIDGPKTTAWGQKVAYFLDPDQNIWEISENTGFFEGIIISESLNDTSILLGVKISNVVVEKVTKRHNTPWVKTWTIYTCSIPSEGIEDFSQKVSKALDAKRNWYDDYRNKHTHYVIFSNKVFRVDLTSKPNYLPVVEYGLSIGIPKHQLDF